MTAFPRGVTPTSPGRAARRGPATPLDRGRLVILVALITLTIGAWTATIHQARTMAMPMGVVARTAGVAPEEAMAGMAEKTSSGAAGMADQGWTAEGAVTFLVAWAVMMAAMMFPAAAPMILLFQAVHARRGTGGGAVVPTWAFASGYLVVWTSVGLLTWVLIQSGSDLAGRLAAADRAAWGPLALGATLAGAGLYQLTPLKRFCLDHCRSPMDFVLAHWREGYGGALRMGVVHGAYCLGCCWALFAVLVAAGVMSLAWMALLTLIVFVEKALPVGPRVMRTVGVVLMVTGVAVAFGAIGMPWSV